MARWTDFYLNEDFSGFWCDRATDKNVRALVILGLGFDPRCLVALSKISKSGFGDRLGCISLNIIPRPTFGDSGNLIDQLGKKNSEKLGKIENCRLEASCNIETHDEEGHSVAGRKILLEMEKAKAILSKYTDVIVDISGMPRGIFFPLIAYLLRLADSGVFKNLHVTVVEDPILDSKISGREYGQADYLHTFRYQGGDNLVWLPMISANEGIRLEKIHSKVKGSCVEICPILPFPAQSLRRVDDIVVKNSELLFEGFLVSPDNILLCDESTPFDAYRKILEVEDYYRRRLGAVPAMGEIKTVVSPLSSKTLSLGMLLATIEKSLPVCYVEAGAYHVEVDAQGELTGNPESEPMEIWLAGEPYIT